MKKIALVLLCVLMLPQLAHSEEDNAWPLDGTKEIANKRVFPKDVFSVDVTVEEVTGAASAKLILNRDIKGFGYKSLNGYICNIPGHGLEKGVRYLLIGSHDQIDGQSWDVFFQRLAGWEIIESDDRKLQVDYRVVEGMSNFPEKSGLVGYEAMVRSAEAFVSLQHDWIAPKHVFIADVTISSVVRYNGIKLDVNDAIAGSFVKDKKDVNCRVYGNKFEKGKRYLFVGSPTFSVVRGQTKSKDFDYLAGWEIVRSTTGELQVNYTVLKDRGYSPFPEKDGSVRYEEIVKVASEYVKQRREGATASPEK
jgi:hypothetical protein